MTCGAAQKQLSGDSQLVCDIQNPLPAGKKVRHLDGSANLYHVDGVLVKFHYLLNLPVCPQVRFKVLMAPARLVPSASELNLTVIVNRLAAAFDTLVFKAKIAIYGIITIDDIMNRISPSTIVMVRTIMFLTKGL